MRVLLLTPYAPDAVHDHAAADTIARLVPLLAERVELFVYSPQYGGLPRRQDQVGYTRLPASAAVAGAGVPGVVGPATDRPHRRSRDVRDRFGRRPAWLRQAWPVQATREAVEAARRIRPDVIHAEYLQSAEALRYHDNTVLGLHDITERVMAESYRAANGPLKAYRLAELVRTRRFERACLRRAAAVLTLSDADFSAAARLNPHTVLARPGVDIGERCWSPRSDRRHPRLVFTGAMWRRANVLAAEFLAREVMPLIWRELPGAHLRLVGARPAPVVQALADAEPRIVVTGTVPDPRAEMLDADAVLAPSVLGGGVLMKVLHAMALGCPVVTSPGPAASVRGGDATLYIASTAAQFAAAVCAAVRTPQEAARRGRAARTHAAATFPWEGMVRGYLDAYAMAGRR